MPLTVDDADRVVKAPVLGVLAPTVMLLIEPAVPIRVVNVPGAGVTAPTVILLIEPAVPIRVVKVPAAGVVPPMAGGLAKYVEKPVPLTVDDADNVVNAPVLGVVAPTEMLLIVPLVAVNVLLTDRLPERVVLPVAASVPVMLALPLTLMLPKLFSASMTLVALA